MRIFLLSFLINVCALTMSAQTHQQALEEFAKLKQKAEAQAEALKTKGEKLEKIILQPDKADLTAANRENANVFRLLPREKYDKGIFKIRGGGAYYSFTNQSHSYDRIPQISLEQNYLQVGFYGASYGFLTDLGEIGLVKIDEKNKSVYFLANYQPPLELSKARVEQEKARGFEFEAVAYKDRLPVAVGHSYIMRAVSYDEADVLVAFKIYRQDTDGSLIIFWKVLKNYEKPVLIRNSQAISVNYSGNRAAKIEEELRKKGFDEVKVSEEGNIFVLRGKCPKGKLAEVVQTAQEANGGKPVRVEVTEK